MLYSIYEVGNLPAVLDEFQNKTKIEIFRDEKVTIVIKNIGK